MARRRPPVPRKSAPPVLELVFGALGGLFAVTMLAIIIWHGAAGSTTRPDIELVLDGVETASGGIAARFTAHNRGTRAAGGVEIEGRLGASTAATTFDFIPGGARRSGTLVFPDSGDRSGIELRVLGYREP